MLYILYCHAMGLFIVSAKCYSVFLQRYHQKKDKLYFALKYIKLFPTFEMFIYLFVMYCLYILILSAIILGEMRFLKRCAFVFSCRRLAVNPCTMMLGMLYCERMRQINPDYLTKISSSDLFVVSLVSSFIAQF